MATQASEWTVHRVREELPDVQIMLWDGRRIAGSVHGRELPFARVHSLEPTLPPMHWEVSWSTLANCLNNNRPVRI